MKGRRHTVSREVRQQPTLGVGSDPPRHLRTVVLRVLRAVVAGAKDDTPDPFPVTEVGAMSENIIGREADSVFDFVPYVNNIRA